MKLTYWKIEHQTDGDCYSIRAKTKKAAIEQLSTEDASDYTDHNGNITLERRTITYRDGFDLLDMCLSEGGEYAEVKEFTIKA